MVRLGDTYPSQMADVEVRMFLYRYASRHTEEGEDLPFSVRSSAGRKAGTLHGAAPPARAVEPGPARGAHGRGRR
jgi:hypothetical protein